MTKGKKRGAGGNIEGKIAEPSRPVVFDRAEIDEERLTAFYRRAGNEVPWRAPEAYRGDPLHRRRIEAIFQALGTPPSGAVLDAGCGGGGLWLDAPEPWRGARVVGLDLAPPAQPVPPLVPVCGKLQKLPFADGSFEAVVCSETLEHLPDPDRAARELARVLAPGGRLIVTVPNWFCLDSLDGSTGAVRRALNLANGLRRRLGGEPIFPHGVNTHLQKKWPEGWKALLDRSGLVMERSGPVFISPYIPYSLRTLKGVEARICLNPAVRKLQRVADERLGRWRPFAALGQLHLFVYRK